MLPSRRSASHGGRSLRFEKLKIYLKSHSCSAKRCSYSTPLGFADLPIIPPTLRYGVASNHQLAITRCRRVIDLDNTASLVCLYVYESMVISHS